MSADEIYLYFPIVQKAADLYLHAVNVPALEVTASADQATISIRIAEPTKLTNTFTNAFTAASKYE